MSFLSNAALERGDTGHGRLLWPDVARGVAVVAMVAYHGAWDLSELRMIETQVTAEPAWQAFAMAVAASFLTLSGVGLVLAHGSGLRPARFGRRLLAVSAGAAAVTVGTWLVFPASYVFFGILHAIALGSLLALQAARWPAVAPAGIAALLFVAPLVLRNPVFDEPLLAFLGLGTRVPVTNDYVPVAPWIGFVFAGVATLRMLPGLAAPRASGAPVGRLLRGLAWLGRHSLVIYLLHQPILFGVLSGYVALAGPSPTAEAAPFLRSCAASCAATGRSDATCRATCLCAADEIKRIGLWRRLVADRLAPAATARVGAIARTCFERQP